MKNIYAFFIIIISLSCCDGKSESPNSSLKENGDIWGTGDPPFLEGKYHFVDISKLKTLHLNVSTEDDIYKMFGKDIKIRLSYNDTPVPRLYQKKYIPIDKIIVYFDSSGTEKILPNGKRHETSERLSVGLYLYKGILKFYSINHEDVKNDKLLKSSTEDVVEYSKVDYGSLWPYQSCDRSYYDWKILKLERKSWYGTGKQDYCEWETPEFEDKLRKQGYYELLKQ